jgi:hypothetical protein
MFSVLSSSIASMMLFQLLFKLSNCWDSTASCNSYHPQHVPYTGKPRQPTSTGKLQVLQPLSACSSGWSDVMIIYSGKTNFLFRPALISHFPDLNNPSGLLSLFCAVCHGFIKLMNVGPCFFVFIVFLCSSMISAIFLSTLSCHHRYLPWVRLIMCLRLALSPHM